MGDLQEQMGDIDYSFALPEAKKRLLGLTQFNLPLANSAAPSIANPAPATDPPFVAPLATTQSPKPTLAIQPQGLKRPSLADASDESSDGSILSRGATNSLAIQPQTALPRLSFRERQALPTTSPGAPAGSAASYRAGIERIEDQKANPWGSPENHPGVMGKVAHVLSRIGNIAGDVVAPRTMAIIPGTDLNRNIRESGLENRFETASDREEKERAARARDTETEEQRRIEERRNEILDRRNDILEGKQPKQTPDEAAIADLQKRVNLDTGRPYTAYEARVQLAQDIQDTKPDRTSRKSPFEAFAYGTPEEKKAAQDFLAFEKRMGSQYQKPTEAEFRYSLFQRDPEGYKAVFGDKTAAADFTRAEHTAKLRAFFAKQRDAISKDFMLGDDEKAQQLRDLDEAEGQFREATGGAGGDTSGGKTVNTADILDYARKNGVSSVEARKHFNDEGYRIVPVIPATAGKGNDRVNVIHPDGTPGTIPRSQLGAAKRKGYRIAQ